MTREDVRQQLAKNPLEWDCTDMFEMDGVKIVDHYAEIVEISCDGDIFYTIREEFDDSGNRTSITLYLTTMDVVQYMYSPYEVALLVSKHASLEGIKRYAEKDRVKKACLMMGVTEQQTSDMGIRASISKDRVASTNTRALLNIRSSLMQEITLMRSEWERAKKYGDYYPYEEITRKENLLKEVESEIQKRK